MSYLTRMAGVTMISGNWVGFCCLIGMLGLVNVQGFSRPPTRVRTGVILTVNAEATVAYDYNIVRPALEAAYEKAAELNNVIFEPILCLYEGGCNVPAAVGQTFICANESVDFIIGPGCSDDLLSSLELQTYFEIPSVTGAGDLVDSTAKFKYGVRCSYNTYTQWMFVVNMCIKYRWTNAAVIYNMQNSVKVTNAVSLMKNLRLNGIRYKELSFDGEVINDVEQYQELLTTAGTQARIIVILVVGKLLRDFMLAAKRNGQTDGDYVFFSLDPFRDDILKDAGWKQKNKYDAEARSAYKPLLILTLHNNEDNPQYADFAHLVQQTSEERFPGKKVVLNYYVASFYDSVMLYARAINETVEEGKSIGDNVDELVKKCTNRTYPGATGTLYINSGGDRNDDHAMYQLADDGSFQVAAIFYGFKIVQVPNYRFDEILPFSWGKQAPPNEPHCGFTGDNPICDNTGQTLGIALGVVAGLLIFFLVVGCLVYNNAKRKVELAQLDLFGTWRDVTRPLISNPKMANKSTTTFGSHTSLAMKDLLEDSTLYNGQTVHATFRSYPVIIRMCERKNIAVNTAVFHEIKTIRDVAASSSTILGVRGLCTGPGHAAVMYANCSKGSVMDILASDGVTLDWFFKFAFIKDLINGLHAIQISTLGCHGRLSSTCCFIDAYFVTKVADYGLPTFFQRTMPVTQDNAFCTSLLWTAPEHLPRPFAGGSQEGDVYSLAIILAEIIMRERPYGSYLSTDAAVILAKLQQKSSRSFRPKLDSSQCPPEISVLTKQCWANNPLERPRLAQIRSVIKDVEKNNMAHGSILDALIHKMENYTRDLEAIVEEKAQQLLHEKEKSEQLLYQILPRTVVDQLKKGEQVKPENFDSVTVFYQDIVAFTTLSSSSSPTEVVDLLNELYTVFDNCIMKFDAYKVETIGDCYVVASGVPVRNGKNHALEICRMALLLLNQIQVFKVRHRPNERLMLRLGAHTGPCVAGVVGLVMPRYCLFGETVTIAAKMESTSHPMKIQISLACEKVLMTLGKFVTELRDTPVQINDKLEITSYWLKEEIFT